jgi:predicted nucleotidyltransferase
MSDMSKELILQKLQAHRKNLRQAYGVQSLILFGSVARSSANPTSDVDLFVTFSEPATFDHYMNLKLHLEELLQCSVDLVTKEGVRPHIMPKIEREGVYVA